MIRSAGGSPAASIASALGSAPTPSAPDADETGRSDGDGEALDSGRVQNNQQRKLDFLGQQITGGVTHTHALQTPASPYEVVAGSVIAASMLTGLTYDLPGRVIALETANVFDLVARKSTRQT